MERPTIVVIGGPNGAGKTTVSREVLAETLGITEFVNADAIAAGLSGFAPERAAFAAGRIMLARLRELAAARRNFAFESTLASRSFVPWLRELKHAGYDIHIIYIWVASADISISRVRARVRQGGHHVSEEVIRRRYRRSAANFWSMYRPIAAAWQVYNNSGRTPRLVASGEHGKPEHVRDQRAWGRMLELAYGIDEEDNQ